MACIIVRNRKSGPTYCVVYNVYDSDGTHHQKWESFRSYDEAKQRQDIINGFNKSIAKPIARCKTVEDLMRVYTDLHGKLHWSLSTYNMNSILIEKYIIPYLGTCKLRTISIRDIEYYRLALLSVPAASKGKRKNEYISAGQIRRLLVLLKGALHEATKWGLIERNPADCIDLPKRNDKVRQIWDAETLFRAIDVCEYEPLKLCLHLGFGCSLRLGEILALTWDCVDISEESIAQGMASLNVTKTLQRAQKSALKALDNKDVFFVFPAFEGNEKENKSVLVLKTPKTKSSIRKVYIPSSIARILVECRKKQQEIIEFLGSEYKDYNLVVCRDIGTPVEESTIREALKKLIEDNDLPPVCFHSVRHTSITYKLQLTGGDIKAVQGDSGHAQAQMVTDQYSHILDKKRARNAQLIEDAFYSGRNDGQAPALPPQQDAVPDERSVPTKEEARARIKEILSQPGAAEFLRSVLDEMGK